MYPDTQTFLPELVTVHMYILSVVLRKKIQLFAINTYLVVQMRF